MALPAIAAKAAMFAVKHPKVTAAVLKFAGKSIAKRMGGSATKPAARFGARGPKFTS